MALISLDTLATYWKNVSDWVKGTDAVSAPAVKLTGSKATVLYGDYDQVLNVAASGAATVTITPPVGELWRIKNVFASVAMPVGATSGTHRIALGTGILNSGKQFRCRGYWNYNIGPQIKYRFCVSASTQEPSDNASFGAAMDSLVVTNAHPLHLYYENLTNAAQTNSLAITVTREVEYIVS